jgi:hypothetical protein
MASAAVIIRFHYDVDDPSSKYSASEEQFEWRFGYFVSMCLPRIRRQAGPPVDVWVWCEPGHRERFERLGCKTFTVKPSWKGWLKPGHEGKDGKLSIAGRDSKLHIDFVPWEAVEGLPQYDLQIAIDSDELLLRTDTFHLIKEHFTCLEKTAHLSFQHVMFDVVGCQLYSSHFRYTTKKGSPFYALWQPNVPPEKFVFVYDNSHQVIWKQMHHTFLASSDLQESHVAASVHPWNSSTRLSTNSQPFSPWKKSPEAIK